MLSLEQLNAIRLRALSGEEIPLDVLKECLAAVRQHRTAITSPKTKKPPSEKPAPSSEEIMAKLMEGL